MSIWTTEFTLEDLNTKWMTPLGKILGMEITEIKPNGLVATIPVKAETQQPYGAWHGGVTCYVAETMASVASVLCVKEPGSQAMGMAVTSSHLRPSFKGNVRFEVTIRHHGQRTHVWAY